MKQGTVSIIVGCHSVVHSYYVVKAWRILYGDYPKLWEIICIFLHDIGHYGLDYLDDYEQKKVHWQKGAWIAFRLFGIRGYALIAGHCSHSLYNQSKLHKADKYSWYICSKWWQYINTIAEPKLKGNMGRWEAVHYFRDQVNQSIKSGIYKSTHSIYLERNQK